MSLRSPVLAKKCFFSMDSPKGCPKGQKIKNIQKICLAAAGLEPTNPVSIFPVLVTKVRSGARSGPGTVRPKVCFKIRPKEQVRMFQFF